MEQQWSNGRIEGEQELAGENISERKGLNHLLIFSCYVEQRSGE
jgi:hypothetical protein